MYCIGSFARELVWCGAASLLPPPPPPSPPSSGLRHFASSSLTCWMCPFEFRWFQAPWWLFALLESRKDHCCVWRLKRFYRLHARKKRVVPVLTCLFAPVAYRDYAPFFGVYRSWLSLVPSLWPLVCWSHSGGVGFSWRRCALWTPAHPWRSSAAVPCTARLCSPPAAIRMLVAFHGQTPQD